MTPQVNEGELLPARRPADEADPSMREWAEALGRAGPADGVQMTGADRLLTGLEVELEDARSW